MKWLVVMLIGLAACSRDLAAGATEGRQVFAATCTPCHGATGKPDQAMVARLGVKDLTDPVARQKLTAAVIERQVRVGSQNKLMPGFAGALRDDQIKAVAAWVASSAFVAK